LAVALAISMVAASASATAPSTFGQGAKSSGVALADVAEPEPTAATQQNAAVAATPGFRLRLGYGYGAMGLTIDGKDAGVRNVSGIDLAGQYGLRASKSIDLGLAMALHLPDAYIARIAFRPATEPSFVLYESSLQRMTFDAVAALRWGPVAIGGGASMSLDVGGDGTDFVLGQDAQGTYADAGANVELPYRAAPIVALQARLGRASLGATFRGPLAVDLHLESKNRVALTGNPLNGTTTVIVDGVSGYDPATVDLGGAVALGEGLTALWAIEYAAYSYAPPPSADVTIDVRLGTVPSQREARFIEPRMRDTLSPRLGLELRRPASRDVVRDRELPIWRWAVRGGYLFAPSPLPRQTGFTTYADAARHLIALGAGYRFGRAAGVDLSLNAAGQLHLFATRQEEKNSMSLPYARYEAGGHVVYGSASLEGSWK
jgi:hypothetical protein